MNAAEELFPIAEHSPAAFPPLLQEITDPPKTLYSRGTITPLFEAGREGSDVRILSVVGSRKYSDYGTQVVRELIGGLRGQPIAIISGLALGIDGLAHRAALDAGLYTLAVPGSGLRDAALYPRKHAKLAREILEHGGGLLSEFEPDF